MVRSGSFEINLASSNEFSSATKSVEELNTLYHQVISISEAVFTALYVGRRALTGKMKQSRSSVLDLVVGISHYFQVDPVSIILYTHQEVFVTFHCNRECTTSFIAFLSSWHMYRSLNNFINTCLH